MAEAARCKHSNADFSFRLLLWYEHQATSQENSHADMRCESWLSASKHSCSLGPSSRKRVGLHAALMQHSTALLQHITAVALLLPGPYWSLVLGALTNPI